MQSRKDLFQQHIVYRNFFALKFINKVKLKNNRSLVEVCFKLSDFIDETTIQNCIENSNQKPNEKNYGIIHIQLHESNQVRNLIASYPKQIYSKHFKYQELPPGIRLIFRNLPQIFVFLQKKDMVYFDSEDMSLKLSILVAGEIKDFAIPLDSHCDKDLAKKKIQYFQNEKAKMVHDFALVSQEKELQCEKSRNILAKINKQNQNSEILIRDLTDKIIQIQQEIIILRRESEQKMSTIRQLAPKIPYGSSSIKPKPKESPVASITKLQNIPQHRDYYTFPTGLQYQQKRIKKVIEQFTPIQSDEEILRQRKIFWLTEIGKLKSDSMQYLKTQINQKTDFQAQGSLFINNLKLANMQFVQIFINLQKLDLSNNNIARIEGLKNLSKVTYLNLSRNKITVIEGLFNLLKLKQLNLRNNAIMTIQSIFHLINLQILDLSYNRIQSIGVTISCLSKLTQLRLNNNQIRKITERVYLLKCLRVFSVLNNPFYQTANKSREIIERLMKNGVRTAEEDIEEIDLSFC